LPVARAELCGPDEPMPSRPIAQKSQRSHAFEYVTKFVQVYFLKLILTVFE
jgi:hypothetical protein